MAGNESVIITVVYGASEVIDRRNLWTALETLSQQCSDIPWMVGGDFNAVRDLNEVCGISGDIRMATEEFNAGILEAGLIPLPMQGEWFTWHNCSTSMRSLWKRLGRILINDRWLARFPSAYYHSLTPRTSDHSPLVLHGDIQQHNGGMFRFDNYLAHSPEFIHNVQNIWHHEIVGIPMYAVTRKLKALKPVFRLQRRNKGDLTMNVQLAKGFLDEAQQLRRVRRRILQINDENGFTHTDLGEIAHEFVSYYQNLLGGTRRRLSVDIRYLRPWARHCITDEEANQLLLPISADDVKQAMFDIADDKAPGPDGYSSRFFKAAWPVVGEEVTRAVLDFFSTGKLLKQVNSTILALIPKMGFADDLLLLCKADLDSIRVFKEGLDWFAEVSGLRLNVQKSHLIISRSAQNLKDQMLDFLGFQEGHLPMRTHGIIWVHLSSDSLKVPAILDLKNQQNSA
ncbi:uncharacterized protein LOC105179325 [Sesamum indicum]|uniref:Uncharacterized protein LOC105179325 n=1 Tax=Sesamum indicum TaxID=4182 RepID=A0A6I9V0U8_SESIN|nr:uncharacterized protein LOC105179325 [Sesamum indicum]